MPEVFGWTRMKLGDFAEIKIGGTPARANSSYWVEGNNGGYPWCSIADLRQGVIEKTKERITLAGVAASNVKPIPAGTLLASFKLSLGRMAIAGVDLYTNEAIAALIPKSNLEDTRFLLHCLPRAFDGVVAETAIKGATLNLTSLKSLEFFAPESPDDRQAIADILDLIDEVIVETDAVIEKLRIVHVGLIDDLLTRGLADDGSPREPFTLVETAVGPRPESWKVANLGRFVVGAEYGTNLSLGDSSAGIPVLRMNNIQDGEFDLSDMKYAPAHAVDRFRLRRNDVLFNRTNSWEHVGKAAIWRRDEPGPAFASYLVRLHCGDALLPEFLHLWLNWAPVQRAIRQFATPGVQQVNINPTNLRRALIAVPDTLDEQRAIIERVSGVAAAIEDHRRERAKLSSLREGLRDDLLTGRKPVVAIREAAE